MPKAKTEAVRVMDELQGALRPWLKQFGFRGHWPTCSPIAAEQAAAAQAAPENSRRV